MISQVLMVFNNSSFVGAIQDFEGHQYAQVAMKYPHTGQSPRKMISQKHLFTNPIDISTGVEYVDIQDRNLDLNRK